MKRIFVLMLTIFCLSFSMKISATSDDITIKDKTAVLETLGIMENSDDRLNEDITRRDFVIAVGKMLGINIYKVDENRYFKDMTSDDRVWNVANALVEQGILTVGEDRMFRPDDVITSGEVACILMRILGIRNAEYSVYFDVASAYDIVGGTPSTGVKYKDAVESIYKTLNTHTFANLGESGFRQSGKTLMDVLYDSFYIEGVVNAVNFTSLYGDTTYGINTIVIGDTVVNSDIDDPYSYLGCYVSAYYREVNGIRSLTDIFVRENKTSKISVDSDNFYAFDNNSYTAEYYTSNDKLRKINIDKGVTIIKNGDNCFSEISSVFEKIENGSITFIDADRNSLYEIIIINSYENVIARYVDTEEQIIYGKYGNPIDVSDETVPVLIISVTGELKSIKDIAPDNVISFYESDNLKRLVISDNTVNGEMVSVSKKNGYTKVKISGTEYVIDKLYLENSVVTLNAGSMVKALVDACGKIADIEITKNTGYMYSYLVTTTVEDGMDTRLKAMMFTENSELEEVYFAAKVNIDGERCTEINQIKTALKKKTGNVDGQLILIKKNSDGEINFVDTAYEESENGGLFVSSKEASYLFFAGQMLLGPNIRISSSSKLFIVPENSGYKTDAKAYRVVNGNKFFTDWESYSVTGYRNGLKNTVGYVDAMVLKRDLVGTKTQKETGNLAMVKEIGTAWDDEEMTVKNEVVLLSGKSEMTYTCSEDYDVLNDNNVKTGNLIYVLTNPKGEMVASRLIFSDETSKTFGFGGWDSQRNSACGYVFDVRDGMIGLKLEQSDTEPFSCLLTTNIPVMVYDPLLKDCVYTGNEGDLIEAQNMGYKVVVNMSRGVTKSFAVMKNR